MTLEEAKKVATMFREIGGFSSVEVEEFGIRTGNYRVYLWVVNARAGNRNLTQICDAAECPDLTAAKRTTRVAKGKATARDQAALARIAAAKEINRE